MTVQSVEGVLGLTLTYILVLVCFTHKTLHLSVWLRHQRGRVLPKSKLGEAITYCSNQWEKLTAFMADGQLEIDNNRSERAIKPFVIGRKNWLFANSPRGAKASAIIYSVIETAKENQLNPLKYLQYLFEQLPQLANPDDPRMNSTMNEQNTPGWKRVEDKKG